MVDKRRYVGNASLVIMKNKFMVKFAWICEHDYFGEIISFLVTPRVRLWPGNNSLVHTLVYKLESDYDEVIRFPVGHPKSVSILKRLAKLNSTQWSSPSYETIEEEFDLDDFFTDCHYQDNYGRELLFYTHKDCLFNKHNM